MEGWGKVKSAADYAGLSERTLRTLLQKGLKHSILPSGTILIKYEWIDEYFESFAQSRNQLERIVGEIENRLTKTLRKDK